jgi:hypothetical protein
MPDAQVVDRFMTAEAVGQGTAAAGGQLIQEPLEYPGVPPGQPVDLLLCARSGEDLGDHGQAL